MHQHTMETPAHAQKITSQSEDRDRAIRPDSAWTSATAKTVGQTKVMEAEAHIPVLVAREVHSCCNKCHLSQDT